MSRWQNCHFWVNDFFIYIFFIMGAPGKGWWMRVILTSELAQQRQEAERLEEWEGLYTAPPANTHTLLLQSHCISRKDNYSFTSLNNPQVYPCVTEHFTWKTLRYCGSTEENFDVVYLKASWLDWRDFWTLFHKITKISSKLAMEEVSCTERTSSSN